MNYTDVKVDQVGELIKQGPITILDSRDMNSFNESHMEGAVPANDIIIEKLIRNKLRAQNVLVYCYRGNSSRDLCSLLGKMGFKSVYNLVGGYTEWKKFQNQNNAGSYLYPHSTWMAEKGFNPANINDRIDNANTPLMEAALEGNVEMVDTLIQKGADVNAVNDDENNALWFGCVANNTTIISLLIEAGINIDHRNVNGASCLVYAASAGKFEAVKQLVEAGIDPFLTTLDGFHALDSASTLAILKYLKPLFRKQVENA